VLKAGGVSQQQDSVGDIAAYVLLGDLDSAALAHAKQFWEITATLSCPAKAGHPVTTGVEVVLEA
jgi:hypothetical protein